MLNDLRFGLRLLVKSPGHTSVVVLTLALGIGLTTAMFSIVYGTFLRGLPFPEADRIVRVERNNLEAGAEHLKVPAGDFLAWREQQRSFEGLAAWYGVSVNVSGSGVFAEPYNCAYGTSNLFDLLPVKPELGRGFRPDDEAAGAPPVVVISDAMWRQRFGGDPRVLGKTLKVDGNETAIVGVMPPGFRFPLNHYLWIPLRVEADSSKPAESFEVFGRLKPRVSREQALADLSTIEERLSRDLPATHQGAGVAVTPYIEGYVDPKLRSANYLMLGAVFGVLLIACANVGSLLLVRGLYRSPELAVRMALGAGQRRVVTQLASESVLLALVGGALGLGVARAAIALYLRTMGDELPTFWVNVTLDRGVLLFALGATLLSSLLAGLIPAWQGAQTNPGETLKDQSRSGSGSRRIGHLNTAFVVVEIALSCALLIATGLMIESVIRLKTIHFGFDPEHLVTGQISLYGPRYSDPESQLRYLEALSARLAGNPAAQAVAFASGLPGVFSQTSYFGIEGGTYATDASYPETQWVVVSPQYFEVFGLRPLQGRSFTPADRRGSEPVAVVNHSFARRYFPRQDPLGKRLRFGKAGSTRAWMTVVGVVPDLSLGGAGREELAETVYLPLAQKPLSWMNVVVQARGTPAGLVSKIRAEGAAVDPDIPIFLVQSMAEDIADVTQSYMRSGALFTTFGILALGLTVLGLYGVMAFSVSRRTKEIGIRAALGALPGDVRQLILKSGLARLTVGLLLGMALAVGFVRTLQALLFKVSPWDPAVFALVPLTLLACGLLACLGPSRRAARVDPGVALRAE
jgi:putative ABC transport system permease protein